MAEPDTTGGGGRLYDIATRQARLEAAPGRQVVDAETHDVEPGDGGVLVEEALPERPDLYATITWRRDDPRPPIVPAWLLNPQQRRAVVHQLLREAAYLAGFHSSRAVVLYSWQVPWYAAKGLLKAAAKAVYWARAEEGNWGLRQHAATSNDAETWLKLDRHRQAQSAWRWWVVGAALLIIVLGVLAALFLAPWWVPYLVSIAGAPPLARVGRPAGRPILVRTTPAQRFTRLTQEMVRNAIASLGIPGVKDPGDIDFPPPGVHRDPPGWLARFNLPGGVTAVKVLEKREGLSSALRLPVDQVWPSAGPEHAGQVDLWVGYEPASKMGQPTWSLTSPTARTSFFEPFEFGTDQRQRPISTCLFELNFLIGGQPGSGKTYGARALALGASLDPIVEMMIAEFKGTGDFTDLAELCSTYVCGVDDIAFERAAAMVEWGLAEAERRGKRIRAAKLAGKSPNGKITPELAAEPGSGLHPIVMLFDEVHELFLACPEAAKAMERLIRRGRALGITIILATQIPDKDSLPPNITRCVVVRWCMSVGDQVANDMILGTGAYKRGLTGTVYRPKLDAGWGVMIGLETPGPVRGQFPNQAQTKALVARATQLRGGAVVTSGDEIAPRDVLADLRTIWVPSWRGAHWDVLAARLAEQLPDAYADLTPDALSAMARNAEVPSQNVNAVGLDGQRAVRRGCYLKELEAAIEARALGSR